ncbi:pentapeptide repeat-containing protein [Streptomyces sp. NPDC059582]|uniref:pentapeptide repeat-containing protein n=1 Tax=Streptomyces sp. NPDC059582 TaxID=3346875 RepID=UPI0036C37AFB
MAGVLGTAGVLTALAVVIWLPQLIYPPLTQRALAQVPGGAQRMAAQQAQLEIQSGFRGQLLQLFGGLVVFVGAAAGWQQLRVAREGQITERFTRAIDHLGSDTLDIRLGGIYALERVAKNSVNDRPTVTDILCSFVREHSPWPVGAPDGPQHPTPEVDDQLPWLTARAPDVQTALYVLGRRPGHPDEHKPYLSRVDLRRALLGRARLAGANLRHSNLSRAYMPGCDLEHGQLAHADLRHANLRGARMAHADLRSAHLQHSDLRGADLSDACLDGADVTGVHTDDATIWPDSRLG